MKEINVLELKNLIDTRKDLSVIDVREPFEVQQGKISCAINIPLGELTGRLSELDRNKEHVIVCQSGSRSYYATQFLEQIGFKVMNLYGGMNHWEQLKVKGY